VAEDSPADYWHTRSYDRKKDPINLDTDMVRKLELEEQLLRYCKFDTEAMVEIVRFFPIRRVS
jgi:hypothetical protein